MAMETLQVGLHRFDCHVQLALVTNQNFLFFGYANDNIHLSIDLLVLMVNARQRFFQSSVSFFATAYTVSFLQRTSKISGKNLCALLAQAIHAKTSRERWISDIVSSLKKVR